jgi:hypothetical protein
MSFGKSCTTNHLIDADLTLNSHLSSLFLTINGNHHANRYFKNSNPHDQSLLCGSGYFPEKETYKAYIAGTPSDREVNLSRNGSHIS